MKARGTLLASPMLNLGCTMFGCLLKTHHKNAFHILQTNLVVNMSKQTADANPSTKLFTDTNKLMEIQHTL